MPRRYFNWKLAIVLLLGFIVLGVTAFGLRKWRKMNSAENALAMGNQAYSEPNWQDAARYFGRYLAVVQDDVPVLMKYAEAQLNLRPMKSDNINQAANSYRIILRVEPNNLEAAGKLIEIDLLAGAYEEAETIARRQLAQTPDPALARMYALALAGQRKFNEAAAELKDLCSKYPEQVLAYEIMGRLIEQNPQSFSEKPSVWFDKALENNPASALAYLIRAEFCLRQKDKTGALRDINRAENQDLSDIAVRLRLAAEMVNVGLFERAQEHLVVVRKAEPANQSLWQILAQLAMRTGSKEKMAEIAGSGLEALSAQPWDFMPTAAELFIRSGRLDRAAEALSLLRQKDIAPVNVAFLSGLLALAKENYYEAVKYWRQSEELGNKSAQLRLSIASALANLGETQSALRQLRTLIAQEPDSADARLAIAKLLASQANWAEAEEQAAKAVALAPGNTEAYSLLLQARMQLAQTGTTGTNEQMLQNLQKQISALAQTSANSIETELLRLQMEMQKGDFNLAGEIIDRLKKTNPSDVRVALAQVDLLDAQGKNEQVISKLNEAVEQFPQSPGPARYLAVLLYRQGEKQQCETILKDAASRINQPVARRELGLLLAQCYIRWNQTDDAYRLLTELAKKLPDDIPIKRGLLSVPAAAKNSAVAEKIVNDIKLLEGEQGWQWRYEQAKLWYNGEDFKSSYPRIVSYLQENLQANPNDQTSRVLLAAAYEKAGEQQLAVSAYKDAQSRSPGDLRILVTTISALYRAEKFEQAEDLLNQASKQQQLSPAIQQLQLQSHLRRGQLDSASDIMEELLVNDPNNQNICLSLAILKMQQGKYDESEQLLDSLASQNPESLSTAAARIRLMLRQKKTEEALRICDEMVKSLNNAAALILRSKTYLSANQADKAQDDLNRAAAIEPANVDIWIVKSDFDNSLGRLEQAVEDIRHALSIAPENLTVQKRAISLFLASGQAGLVRTGSELIEKALKSHPDDVELQLLKAGVMLTEGTAPSLESSKKILQQITANQPDSARAWQMLSELTLMQDQPTAAMDMAIRGLIYSPGDKQLMFLKARTEAARSPVLAVPTLRELCEKYPSDVYIAAYLANIYITTGEPQKAVELLTKQKANSDASSQRQYDIALAVALYKTGKKQQALEQFAQLSESEPNDSAPLLAQTQLLLEDKLWDQLKTKITDWYQKHPKDSATVVSIAAGLAPIDSNEARQISQDMLEMVRKNEPDNILVNRSLAMVLQSRGLIAEAAQQYHRVLELDPNNVLAINNLAWIMCEQRKQYQEALELAEKGLRIQPQYIDLIDTRGVINYRLGRSEQAVKDLTRAVELYPATSSNMTVAMFHLARALAGAGQKVQAKEYLNQAIARNNKKAVLSAEEVSEAQQLQKKLQ